MNMSSIWSTDIITRHKQSDEGKQGSHKASYNPMVVGKVIGGTKPPSFLNRPVLLPDRCSTENKLDIGLHSSDFQLWMHDDTPSPLLDTKEKSMHGTTCFPSI